MGTDFSRKCQVESRRVVWIVALVLASVLVVQYFDIPYGGRVLSLFPVGKSYFNISDANGGIGYGGQQSNLMNHSSPTRQKSEEGSVSKENIVPDIKHTDEEDSMVRTASLVPEKSSSPSQISPSSVEIETAAALNEASDGNVGDVSPSISVTAATTLGEISRSPTNLSAAPAPCQLSDETYNVSTSNSTTALASGEDARIAASRTASDVSSLAELAPSESVSPRKINVDVENGTSRNENNGALNGPIALDEHSSAINSPPPTEQPKSPSVASILDMNDMLLRSRASSFSEVCINN